MEDFDGTPRGRMPLVIGVLAVVVLGLLTAIIVINKASNASPLASAISPSAVIATPATSVTPAASPTAAQIPFADCAAVTFGAPLAPLNAPSDPHVYPAAPAMTIDTTKLYQATFHTAKGDIVACLQPNLAPNTVNVIVTLIRNKFYDGLIFHRVCPNTADTSCGGTLAIIQGGDPAGSGNGGPGFKFKDEPVHQQYVAGSVAMANSGVNTNGSQFYIDTGPNQFPPSYNLFGKVETGLDVAQKIAKGDAMTSVTVAQQQ